MTAPAARKPRTRRAAQPEPPAPEDAAEAAPEPAPKTLLGQVPGKHTAPVPEHDPAACVLCGEHVDWPPVTFAYAPPYPLCRDIPACLERAFSRSASRPAEDALEPLPEPAP